MKISSVHARQILDSRGNPTVEADVLSEDGCLDVLVALLRLQEMHPINLFSLALQ